MTDRIKLARLEEQKLFNPPKLTYDQETREKHAMNKHFNATTSSKLNARKFDYNLIDRYTDLARETGWRLGRRHEIRSVKWMRQADELLPKWRKLATDYELDLDDWVACKPTNVAKMKLLMERVEWLHGDILTYTRMEEGSTSVWWFASKQLYVGEVVTDLDTLCAKVIENGMNPTM
jgi:hypothetical protein